MFAELQLLAEVSRPQALFVDYFDTVVTRVVHPEDVKRIACKHLAPRLSSSCDGKMLYGIRARLERELCLENQSRGYDLEFRLQDLGQKLHTELRSKNWLYSQVSVEALRDELVRIEIETETKLQRVDEQALSTIREIRLNGSRVYCLSDFFMTGEHLRQIMKKLGVIDLYDEVFVSADSLLTKRSGRLYDRVLHLLGLEPDRALMVGDNKHSDYQVPRSKGLSAVWINRAEQHARYEQLRNRTCDKKIIWRRIADTLESYRTDKKIKFPELALALFHFTSRLRDRAIELRARDLFFLAREGAVLKRCFDYLMQWSPCNDFIKTHYLIASRRSTLLASVESIQIDAFETLFRQYRKISVAEFLLSLGFRDEEIVAFAKTISLNFHAREDDLPTSIALSRLIQEDVIREALEERRAEQRQLFRDYLASFNPDYDQDGLNLVDVGWKGTMQDHIASIVPENVSLRGLYLGLVASGAADFRSRKEGLLFSSVGIRSPHFRIYDKNRSLFELLFVAEHASALRYKNGERGAEPVLDQLGASERLVFERTLPALTGIESCFRDVCNILAETPLSYLDFVEEMVDAHARLVLFPTKDEIEFFWGLVHRENFGVFEDTYFGRSDSVTLGQRFRNLGETVRHPRKPLESGWWYPAKLRELGLDFLQPAYGLYQYYQWQREWDR